MAFQYCILLALMIIPSAICYSTGAPEKACGDMMPVHHVDPQPLGTSRYNIHINTSKARPGQQVTVKVSGLTAKDTIKGFMIQARVGNTAIGKFEIDPNDKYMQPINCGNGVGSGVTHKKIEGDGPNQLTFVWSSPEQLSEHVQFWVTTAFNGGVFWVGQKSDAVHIQ